MIADRSTEMLTHPQVQSDRFESQYHRVVEERLKEITTECQSPAAIFSKMRGVFPAEIIQYHSGLKVASESVQNREAVPHYYPQLHALNYEWYFTQDTAKDISQEFVSRRNLTICLGVPTVASAAIKEGKQGLVFVDRNPHALTRFPEIMRASEVHLMDVVQAQRIRLNADVLILDPPWYLGDSLTWLVIASHLVKRAGTIAFALYPSLVKPTAQLERDLILEVASSIGKVHITEDSLAYQTPLFEREALKACGLRYIGDWRRGDLVVIKDTKPVEISVSAIPCRNNVDGRWETFVIGSQVVKLRAKFSKQYAASRNALLNPIEGSFVLSTVSVRDNRRDSVHVWTSVNVAQCIDLQYAEDGSKMSTPEPELTPEYYSSEKCPAWFKFRWIDTISRPDFVREFAVVPYLDPTLYQVFWRIEGDAGTVEVTPRDT